MFFTNAKSFNYEGSERRWLVVRSCHTVHIGCLSRVYELLLVGSGTHKCRLSRAVLRELLRRPDNKWCSDKDGSCLDGTGWTEKEKGKGINDGKKRINL